MDAGEVFGDQAVQLRPPGDCLTLATAIAGGASGLGLHRLGTQADQQQRPGIGVQLGLDDLAQRRADDLARDRGVAGLDRQLGAASANEVRVRADHPLSE